MLYASIRIIVMLLTMLAKTRAASKVPRDKHMERWFCVYVSDKLATSHVGGIQYEHPRVLPQTRLMQIIKLSRVPTASTEACIFEDRLSLFYPVGFQQDGWERKM